MCDSVEGTPRFYHGGDDGVVVITSVKEIMFSVVSDRTFACEQDYANTTGPVFTKLYGNVYCRPR